MTRRPTITVGWLHEEQTGHAMVGTVIYASSTQLRRSKRIRVEHAEHADDAGQIGAVVTIKSHRLIQLIDEPEAQR